MKKLILLTVFVSIIKTVDSQTALLNGGFEDTLVVNLSGTDYTLAQHWNGSGYGAGLTTDAATGNKAAVVNNWYYYGRGYIQNGDPNDPNSHGTPIDFRPTALTGSYKYILGEVFTTNDSAVGTVFLTKFNTVTHLQDTIGRGVLKFPAQSNYTSFYMEISYNSEDMPDSVFVKFQSSQNGFCDTASDGNCLFFYIDDVSLVHETAGINQAILLKTPSVFPNPGKDQVRINNSGDEPFTAELLSSDGRILSLFTVGANASYTINCSDFFPGIYFFRIENGRSVIKWIRE